MPFTTTANAIRAIQPGQMIILCDDESRENEGDLCIAAEHITPAAITFMARHGCGLICLAMLPERLDQLDLPLMVDNPKTYALLLSGMYRGRDEDDRIVIALDKRRKRLNEDH